MHQPVLCDAAIAALNIDPEGIYIDATYGRGGHSAAILQQLGPSGRLIVFDRDPEAIASARQHYGDHPRVEIVPEAFSAIGRYCRTNRLEGCISGVLFDLGVSSPQLDTPERGFSFMHNGPLDMRMDTRYGESAAEVLRRLSQAELARIFKVYGEERFATKIAAAIKHDLAQGYIFKDTGSLAGLIRRVAGRSQDHKHPATRCFQALRIYVNNELGELEQALKAMEQVLAPNGRLVVISFHSLEDRITKQYMQATVKSAAQKQHEQAPRGLPIREEVTEPPLMRWVVKKKQATRAEQAENERARSAVLRAVARTSQT